MDFLGAGGPAQALHALGDGAAGDHDDLAWLGPLAAAHQGREQDALLRLVEGESIGTLLVAATQKVAARKQWMADHLQLRGAVVVDDGAALKLRDEGKSLLPIGVIEVSGEFARGDVIAVRTAAGAEIARGLANYAASETRRIARKPSSQIEGLLGYANEPELIHRDNLVRL